MWCLYLFQGYRKNFVKMEALNSNMLLHFQNKELDGPKEELLTFYVTKLCVLSSYSLKYPLLLLLILLHTRKLQICKQRWKILKITVISQSYLFTAFSLSDIEVNFLLLDCLSICFSWNLLLVRYGSHYLTVEICDRWTLLSATPSFQVGKNFENRPKTSKTP